MRAIELRVRTEEVPGITAPDRHPLLVYLGRLPSPESRRTMRLGLEAIADAVSGGRVDALGLRWAGLRYEHTQRIRSLLIESGRSPATINKLLAGLRGVLRECWRLGLVSAEDFHRAVDFERVTGSRLPRGRCLDPGEIRALFEVCGAGARGARDAALLAVGFGCGLRRSEAVGLDVRDVTREPAGVRVRSGKGRKERMIPIVNGVEAALLDWISIRSDEPGPLLTPVSQRGEVEVRRLKSGAVNEILLGLQHRAGLRPFTPHDLRRSFISCLLDSGADLATVQRLAGHSSPTTTSAYDRRDERAAQRAAALIHVPYVRRMA